MSRGKVIHLRIFDDLASAMQFKSDLEDGWHELSLDQCEYAKILHTFYANGEELVEVVWDSRM